MNLNSMWNKCTANSQYQTAESLSHHLLVEICAVRLVRNDAFPISQYSLLYQRLRVAYLWTSHRQFCNILLELRSRCRSIIDTVRRDFYLLAYRPSSFLDFWRHFNTKADSELGILFEAKVIQPWPSISYKLFVWSYPMHAACPFYHNEPGS